MFLSLQNPIEYCSAFFCFVNHVFFEKICLVLLSVLSLFCFLDLSNFLVNNFARFNNASLKATKVRVDEKILK